MFCSYSRSATAAEEQPASGKRGEQPKHWLTCVTAPPWSAQPALLSSQLPNAGPRALCALSDWLPPCGRGADRAVQLSVCKEYRREDVTEVRVPAAQGACPSPGCHKSTHYSLRTGLRTLTRPARRESLKMRCWRTWLG